MILLDGYQDENQTKGFFFKSESCNSKNFLIKIETKQINHNCLVTIFELEDIPQANVTVLNIKNGSQICTNNLEYVCEIDLCIVFWWHHW